MDAELSIDPDEFAAELLALAGVALAHEELNDALDSICRIAARAVPRADGASLTAFNAAGPEAVAASDEWAGSLDEMQFVEREGPCIDAARTGALFRVRDIGEDPRWPSYMPRAYEQGARSMLSIPMTVESTRIGALNIYSRQVDAFGPEQSTLAEIIAGHASLAMQVAAALHGHRALAEHLREVLASRSTIEQAKGIIMATSRCSADDAFQRLVDQSQHENRKLRDIAADIVARYER